MSVLDKLPPVPDEELSIMQRLKKAGKTAQFVAGLSDGEIEALPYRDDLWMRRKQLALVNTKAGITLGMGGRGWGKTRVMSATVKKHLALKGVNHGAIVARTESEFIQFILEGESGILASSPPNYQPHWRRDKRQLLWPDGKRCTVVFGDSPEQAKGLNLQFAVIDEGAKFHDLQTLWKFLIAALRVKHPLRGTKMPPALFTTTPEPHPTLNSFVERALDSDPEVLVVTGATYENIELPSGFIEELIMEYGVGTRLYQQEILGKLLMDIPGALWSAESFNNRYKPPMDLSTGDPDALDAMVDEMSEIVVGVDPSGARGKEDVNRDQIGIGLLGRHAGTGRVIVMADETLRASGDEWPMLVASLFRKYRADMVVGETNFGGDMVRALLHAADPSIPYTEVRASKGKGKRAQPVAANYAAGRVQHVDHVDPRFGAQVLKKLENQMMAMTSQAPPFDYQGDGSPDRADAVIWGATYLLDLDTSVKQPTFGVPSLPKTTRRRMDLDLM